MRFEKSFKHLYPLLIFYSLTIFNFSVYAQQRISKNTDAKSSRTSAIQQVSEIIDSLDNHIVSDSKHAEELALKAIQLSDSLGESELKVKAEYLLGVLYAESNQFGKAKEVIHKVIDKSKEKGYDSIFVVSQIELSEIFFKEMNLDSALWWLTKSEENVAKYQLTNQNSVLLNLKAKIYDERGEWSKAIELYLQVAKILEQNNDANNLAGIYNSLATLNMGLKNFPIAIDYYNRAINSNKQLNNISRLNTNYSNLGVLYKITDSLKLSTAYFLKSIDLSKKLNDDIQLARAFMNLGNVRRMQSQLNLAEAYIDSSRNLCIKNNFEYGILLNNINLCEIYQEKGQTEKAIQLLLKCNENLKKYKLPEIELQVTKMLANFFESNNEFKNSLFYLKRYQLIDDSIASVETNKTILELQTKYDKEKSENEIIELKQNVLQERVDRQFYLYVLSFSILLIIIGIVLFYVQRRKAMLKNMLTKEENKNLKLQVELRERELVNKALQNARINELINEIGIKLRALSAGFSKETKDSLKSIENELKSEFNNHAWKEFETRYEKVHEDFYNKLVHNFPSLSPTEIKICSLIRLNLSTKDISLLTNRGIGTIDNSRSLIRKKLQMESDGNLTSFLLNL